MVFASTRSTMGEESLHSFRQETGIHQQGTKEASSSVEIQDKDEAEEDDKDVVPPPPNDWMSVMSITNENNTNTNESINNNNINIMNKIMMPCMDMFEDVNGGSPWFDDGGVEYNCV
jgi:hypothetical protein